MPETFAFMSYVFDVDIAPPGILVWLPELKGALLIDGWHRLARRIELGEETMPCYVFFEPSQIRQFTTKYGKPWR